MYLPNIFLNKKQIYVACMKKKIGELEDEIEMKVRREEMCSSRLGSPT